ncbi:MAG: peptide-methionine (R)-S-oxide reductase MsrB [Acidimicrobiales bacterium]
MGTVGLCVALLPGAAGRPLTSVAGIGADPVEGAMTREIVKSEDEWRAELAPDRYHVLREKGTEPAWSGALLDVHDPGLFRCAGCNAELFRSDDKFDSGSGWPSFTRAVADGVIDEHEDRTLGMARTEITCRRCGSHLGHVFPDGPRPTGMRYCVNSLSIEFEPEQDTSTHS